MFHNKDIPLALISRIFQFYSNKIGIQLESPWEHTKHHPDHPNRLLGQHKPQSEWKIDLRDPTSQFFNYILTSPILLSTCNLQKSD